MPPFTGAITTLRKRDSSSSAGWSANAALPGLGLFAREDARIQSPDPQYSGANQSAGISAAKATSRKRSCGSRNHSQRP